MLYLVKENNQQINFENVCSVVMTLSIKILDTAVSFLHGSGKVLKPKTLDNKVCTYSEMKYKKL